MEKLEKMIVENGITYVLGEDDIYYPDLQLPEGTNYNIEKYGHMRCEYLKEFRRVLFRSKSLFLFTYHYYITKYFLCNFFS